MAEPEVDLYAVGRSFGRVRVVARQTLVEALRLRLALLLGVTAVGLVVLSLWLRALNFGAVELKFLADFGLGVIGLLGCVLAALATAQLHFQDIEGGLAAVILTRPPRRGEYSAGKLSGVAALLAIFVALLTGELAAILAARAGQLGTAFPPVALFLQAGALLWLKLVLVAAMTLFVSSYARSALFATSAGLLLALAAHLRPFTSAEGWMAWLRLWPNLGLFDTEPLLRSGGPHGWALAGLAGYWLCFVGVFLALATYVFRRREF